MEINGIRSIIQTPAVPEQKTKGAAPPNTGISGEHSPNPDLSIIPSSPIAEDQGVDEARLKRVVEHANKLMESLNSHLDFSIDESTKRVVVKVINGDTDEVIRQIPAKEMLALSAKFSEINAVLFSQKV